jgi:allantoinase
MSPGRTLITRGTLVSDYGVFPGDLVLDEGRISAITETGALQSARFDHVLDATGLHIFPGAIDPHAHFEDPGHTEREDFTTGTMAAAAGGITTVFEHPLTYPPVTTAALYREKREMARAKAIVDFGLWGALTPPSLTEMRTQFHEGAGGFKAFMPFSEPAYPHVDDAQFLKGMQIAKALDALVLVHAESDSLLQANIERLRSQGRLDPLAHHETRPPIVEEEAVHRALFLAAQTGVRLQIVHVSTPGSASLIRKAKLEGAAVSMEVCPHHLLLDLDDLVRLGPYGRCAPALRGRALVEQLWDHVLAGTVDSLVSDHCAYTIEEKDAGLHDIFAAPLGCQVMQETVPLVLDEAIYRRGMSLDAFARFSSTNAARITRLYPQKGTLFPGSDADLAFYDLDSEWVVDAKAQQFSKNPWSPFDGRRVRARLVRTLVRGQTVYADGEICVRAGYGHFLSSQDHFGLRIVRRTPSEYAS